MVRKLMWLFKSLLIGCLVLWGVQYGSAMEEPYEVELDTLAGIYEAVIFDHDMHVGLASCAICHHHTTGETTENEKCVSCHKVSVEVDEVACTGCHDALPSEAELVESAREKGVFHFDRTGLKRAYHVLCMECHKEMDVVSGCEDCHIKKEESG